MSKRLESTDKPVQAHLNFLVIYNPSLGTSEETAADQIVFYYSGSEAIKRRPDVRNGAKSKGVDQSDAEAEFENEKLRQVGLAQGMVAFGRNFSDGQAVRAVETEKHRIVMGELDKGWWILSSIHLTRNLRYVKPAKKSGGKQDEIVTDYSSRDISPPELLVQQLLRAHRIFTLHHGPSLNDLYARSSREIFCSMLDRYWAHFARNWDVRLHGNPTVEIYDGIKLAAGGELGIGVGEEDWGSGEREVLEGLVHDTDGLVDMIVHRYGQTPSHSSTTEQDKDSKNHGGSPQRCMPGDGLLFSGIGTLSTTALRSISDWTQLIYLYGERAYGVKDNPTAGRRRKRQHKVQDVDLPQDSNSRDNLEVDENESPKASDAKAETEAGKSIIPPPIAIAADDIQDATMKKTKPKNINKEAKGKEARVPIPVSWNESEYWSYLKFGYGSTWGPGSRNEQDETTKVQTKDVANADEVVSSTGARSALGESDEPDTRPPDNSVQIRSDAQFVIGLLGDLTAEDGSQEVTGDETDSGHLHESIATRTRIRLRTLHVEVRTRTLADSMDLRQSGSVNVRSQSTEIRRLRVVVYVHPPFMFTLLFEVETSSLSIPSFFKTLRSHFIPLHKPLLLSTCPANVASRLQSVLHPFITESHSTEPIYHLVFDPQTLLIQSSLPNIPYPGTLAAEGLSSLYPSTGIDSPVAAPQWNRVETLSAHNHILQIYSETHDAHNAVAKERYAKTSRGCCIFWLRTAAISDATPQDSSETVNNPVATLTGHSITMTPMEVENPREAFLVRKAGDVPVKGRSGQAPAEKESAGGFARASAPFARLSSKIGGGEASVNKPSWAGARLVDGIGVDPRRYVESILSLNR